MDRYSGFAFDPADLQEDVDLDAERRREILFAEGSLPRWTHWDVLGLAWNAPVEAARAAYLEKVKVFHPDRYPGKRLGSYRARLEKVFRRLTEARDVLCDEARRAAYARQTAPADEFARMELRKLEDERRSAERRARLARQSPLVARAGRVADLVRRGKEALQAGQVAQAANDLVLAQGMDPQNAEVAALAAEARGRAAVQRAGDAYERGLAAEAMGAPARALAAFREALEADPRHARAAAGGARAALAAGDAVAARELAEAAVRAQPSAGFAHEALGLALEAQGARKEARRALERAVELDPKLEQARERLKRLRWSFLG
ncbi:tetratricopeptide repeat protein [Anaeromyxobacter sp. Red801]|uniref:J domain-containing protein n=1 Tax=Anaeromyxobacter sp. Red801 TaxID=3411632 RepID=UPI003B9E7240